MIKSVLLCTLLLVAVTLACDNTGGYKQVSPSKVYTAKDLPSDELDLHVRKMREITVYAKEVKALFTSSIVDPKTGETLCMDMNRMGTTNDPTQHGEIVVLQNCSRTFKRMDWQGYYLYTTGESCPMCQSAIMWAKFTKVIYGTSINTLYCNKCMGQIPIDSNFLNAYSYGIADGWKGTQIIGDIISNETDTIFEKYCGGDKPWTVSPDCRSTNSGSAITTNVVLVAIIALISVLLF
eukprot:gene3179-3978_t